MISDKKVTINEIRTGIPAYITIDASNYRQLQIFVLLDYTTETLWVPSEIDRNMIGDLNDFTTKVFESLQQKQLLDTGVSNSPSLATAQIVIDNIHRVKQQIDIEKH